MKVSPLNLRLCVNPVNESPSLLPRLAGAAGAGLRLLAVGVAGCK